MNTMPSTYVEKERKARKEHKCCNCYQTIGKGEEYIYVSVIWDGKPTSYKSCIQCMTAFNNFREMDESLDHDEGPAFGELIPWLREYLWIGWTGEDAIHDTSEKLEISKEHAKLLLRISED